MTGNRFSTTKQLWVQRMFDLGMITKSQKRMMCSQKLKDFRGLELSTLGKLCFDAVVDVKFRKNYDLSHNRRIDFIPFNSPQKMWEMYVFFIIFDWFIGLFVFFPFSDL